MKNYYEILEVSENASTEVIERAYKVLAKKYHPDTWPKDKIFFAESKFKEITEAYEVLSNPNSRKNYDIKIGLNSSLDDKYNNLYSEHEKLKQEINNIKINNESQKYINQQENINRFVKPNPSYFKKYINQVGDMIQDERRKPAEERSRDFKALVLTIIIVSILIFIFWKVPFLRNIIFP